MEQKPTNTVAEMCSDLLVGTRCKLEKIEVNRPQETEFLNNKAAKCRLGWGRKRTQEET